jgi:hypothetical protein
MDIEHLSSSEPLARVRRSQAVLTDLPRSLGKCHSAELATLESLRLSTLRGSAKLIPLLFGDLEINGLNATSRYDLVNSAIPGLAFLSNSSLRLRGQKRAWTAICAEPHGQ